MARSHHWPYMVEHCIKLWWPFPHTLSLNHRNISASTVFVQIIMQSHLHLWTCVQLNCEIVQFLLTFFFFSSHFEYFIFMFLPITQLNPDNMSTHFKIIRIRLQFPYTLRLHKFKRLSHHLWSLFGWSVQWNHILDTDISRNTKQNRTIKFTQSSNDPSESLTFDNLLAVCIALYVSICSEDIQFVQLEISLKRWYSNYYYYFLYF